MHISGGVLRLVMRGLVSDLLTCVCLLHGSWKNNYCLSWSSPSSMNPIQIVTKNFLQTQFSPPSPQIGPIPIILGQFPRWLLSFRTFSFLITKRNHRNSWGFFFSFTALKWEPFVQAWYELSPMSHSRIQHWNATPPKVGIYKSDWLLFKRVFADSAKRTLHTKALASFFCCRSAQQF